MKVTYEFNEEDDHEERKIFERAKHFYCALADIEQLVRSYQKYEEKVDLDPKAARLLCEIRERISESGYGEIM